MADDPLRDTLVELVQRLKPSGIELIIGGGYGLVLRGRLLALARQSPRYGISMGFRSTDDLDCFLSAEVVTDGKKTQLIVEVLTDLGFVVLEPNWIFQRSLGRDGRTHSVKIDLLAADVPAEKSELVARKAQRIRPQGSTGLHARRGWRIRKEARDLNQLESEYIRHRAIVMLG